MLKLTRAFIFIGLSYSIVQSVNSTEHEIYSSKSVNNQSVANTAKIEMNGDSGTLLIQSINGHRIREIKEKISRLENNVFSINSTHEIFSLQKPSLNSNYYICSECISNQIKYALPFQWELSDSFRQ